MADQHHLGLLDHVRADLLTPLDCPVRASGALVLSERHVLEGIVGVETVRQALAKLPEDLREEYESVTSVARPRVPVVERVYAAVAMETGSDLIALHREVVTTGMERTVHTLWRVLLRFTGDTALVARTPLFFSKSFSQGRLASRITHPGRAEIELTGWPDVSKLQINGIMCGVEGVLRYAGRKNVRMSCTKTQDGAVMVATWSV